MNFSIKFGVLALALSSTVFASEKPKNMIMIVGDGMGPAYTTAFRYYNDDRATELAEQTVFDRHLVGMASTYPHIDDGFVTDSAASATALATGKKSYNGAIGVDHNKHPIPSVLEQAKIKGLKTGIVVTSQINHATPASYASHNEHRKNYNAIADSYFDDQIDGEFKLDVMLGGGEVYFKRDDRNLVQEFQQAGFQYIDSYAQLTSIKSGSPVLGLFGEKGLKSALDTSEPERLRKMVQAAIKQLENEQGYFLLIEASQIDWAGHGNDIATAIAETAELANTLEWLEQYVKQNSDTLVVVTADHSTGGLTLASNNVYRWDPTSLKNISASPYSIAKHLNKIDSKADKIKITAEQYLGFELTSDEVDQLVNTQKLDPNKLAATIKRIIDIRTNTGWTTNGHTAIDVQVFAFGKNKNDFAGYQDNIEIAEKFFNYLQ
jgi:alkaline phosphatase